MRNKKYFGYKAIAGDIRSKIEEGIIPPGERIETEYALSQKYEVNRMTARHALSLLEEEGFVIRRQGSGTFVVDRSAAKSKLTRAVGFLENLPWAENYLTRMRVAEEICSARGYPFHLSATNYSLDKERALLLHYIENPIQGLLVVGTKTAQPSQNYVLFEKLISMGVKLVFLESYGKYLPGGVCVASDDRKGGRMAAEMLIKNGHRKIATIFSFEDIQSHMRYSGVLDAANEAGIEISERNTMWYSSETVMKMTDGKMRNIESAAEKFIVNKSKREIMEMLDECTAIISYTSLPPIVIASMLKESGKKIPQDISMICFDNLRAEYYNRNFLGGDDEARIAAFKWQNDADQNGIDNVYGAGIAINSFDHDVAAIGRIGAQKLMSMLDGKEEKSEFTEWMYKDRGSVASI